MMRNFDRALQFFSTRISPQAFVRLALVISGVWLLALYPALNWLCPERLPVEMRMGGCDFGQYYTGALVARHGLWTHLYPTQNREIYNNPPQFKPQVSTKLFNPKANRQGQWDYYPQIASPAGSKVAPEILALCPQLQEVHHFIYPPPLAVLLWPLGFLDYQTALSVWFALTCAAFFGMAYFSSRICRILWNRTTYAEGWVALMPVIPTLLASNMSTTLAFGNASPLLGFLIVGVVYAWLHNRQLVMSLGIIPLVLFKGIGLSWCPLLLLKPVKWKTIAGLTLLTLLFNGVTLYQGGTEPYRTFFVDVLPKASIALGVGLPGLLMKLLGVKLGLAGTVLNLGLLGGIYWGYWRRNRATDPEPSPSTVIAAVAGTLAIFCLFNKVVWPHHYYVNYLMIPFAGWILWEGAQARGAWKKWIFGMFALSFLFWLDTVFLMKTSWLVEGMKHAGVYSQHLDTARSAISGLVVLVLPPLEFVFLLVLAYRRLFFLAPQVEAAPVPAPAATK
jgi:hypothetical protein